MVRAQRTRTRKLLFDDLAGLRLQPIQGARTPGNLQLIEAAAADLHA
jgi:hypothetical protein